MSNPIDDDFIHLEWIFDGLENLIVNPVPSFSQLTGNESHFVLFDEAWRLGGCENKFWDGVKSTGRRLFEQIQDMLKRIRDFFFGEGEDTAKASLDKAMNSVTAMMKLGGSAPIPADSPMRDPDTYIKPLEGGVEFEEVKEENRALATSIAKVKSIAQNVKGADTVSKLRAVYAEMGKAAAAGINSVSVALKPTLTKAERAAGKLRNIKLPKDNDPGEVSEAIRIEYSENSREAKEQTKKARIIGGIRNKFVGTLNQISAQSKRIKDNPPKSKFRG